jgi:hypothetical protein
VPPRIAHQRSTFWRLARGDDAAVGEHHAHVDHVVAVHAVGHRREAVAAALHVAADAHVGALAARHVQAVAVKHRLELAERAAGADGGDLRRRVDRHVVQTAHVDQRAVARRETGRAVAARAHGERQHQVLCELQRDRHVRLDEAVDDHHRIGVEHRIEQHPVGVVLGVTGSTM